MATLLDVKPIGYFCLSVVTYVQPLLVNPILPFNSRSHYICLDFHPPQIAFVLILLLR